MSDPVILLTTVIALTGLALIIAIFLSQDAICDRLDELIRAVYWKGKGE